MDADDRVLPPGEVGDIVLRGGFMHGYWGRPDKTAEATRGGWLAPATSGLSTRRLPYHAQPEHRTDRGRGRALVPARRRGGAVPAAGVRQAALVGVPDPRLGRRPSPSS